MPRSQKLKVFRTPIGFHDAYVAAPSQKAALKAWGSEHDLFARGIAERVEDPKLTKAALAQPGVVLRRLRGSADEHFAALPPEPKRRPKAAQPEPIKAKPKPTRRKKPPPKPDRAPLRLAEQALAKAEAAHAAALKTLERREAALEKKHDGKRAQLERKVETEQARYERAAQARRDWESD